MKKIYLTGLAFLVVGLVAHAQTEKVFDDVKLTIENASVNTPNSDFASTMDGDELVYNSAVKVSGKKKNENYLLYDVFKSTIQPVGRLAEQGESRSMMTTKIHEGPMSICEATDEMYMTESYTEETDVKNIVFKKENVRLGIMMYTKANGEWKKDKKFPFNSRDYSVAHPSFSPSGDTLIFVSDMPGGYGGTDLYYTVREDGEWGDPVNLGSKINTAGMEMFPSWEADGTLFFASDSLGGKGGLDVFYAQFKKDQVGEVLTFDNEINSDADDFGFFTGPDRRYAYFSSNRSGGEGSDDIYVVLPEEFKLSVLVISTNTDKAVPEAQIVVKDEDGRVAAEGITDAAGRLPLKLAMNKKYELTASKLGYYDKLHAINLTAVGEFASKEEIVYIDPSHRLKGQVVNILGNSPVEGAMATIERDGVPVDTAYTDAEGFFKADIQPGRNYLVTAEADNFFGADVEFETAGMEPGELFYLFQLYPLDAGTRIGLTNIYYDFNKYTIRPDAARDLDRLAQTMQKYPDLEIRFESHTDARGTDEYNMKLSQRRAKATLDYLVRKGIDTNRMEYEGFGEGQLVNDCSDGVECTEEQHQENRRTVFLITKSKVTRQE